MEYQTAVVGGGAAGLAAAVTAGARGERVILLEAQSRVGRKLLSTGNGRCNLTNLGLSAQNYHGDAAQAAPILEGFPPARLLGFFEKLGLPCRELAEGRMYPYSLQAASVLDTLYRRLEDLGVTVRCDFPVSELRTAGKGGFALVSQTGERTSARRVILCAGGKAAPQLGGSGSGLELAKSLGHTVTPVTPALVGLECPSQRIKPLKGARNPAAATLLIEGRQVRTTHGEAQFSENGLSGICVQELARWVRPGKACAVSLDLLPQWSLRQVRSHLESRRESATLPAADLLCNCMNRLLAREIARQAFGKAGLARELTSAQLEKAAGLAKGFVFPVTDTQGWKQAQVMAGGVPLGEIRPETMESRRCPGLYLAGELLNLDGDCGGYNLHWAFATGILAGKP